MSSDTTVIDKLETAMNTAAPESDTFNALLQDVLKQLAGLSARLTEVEKLLATAATAPPSSAGKVEASVSEPATPSSVAAAAGISEEEFLAISAALAAWLGVQAHIRQIRLIHSGAWAQQGRATIQASHRLFL